MAFGIMGATGGCGQGLQRAVGCLGGGPSFTIWQKWSWCSPFILRRNFNWFPERHPGEGWGAHGGPPNPSPRGTDEAAPGGRGFPSCLPRQDSSLSFLIGTGERGSNGRKWVLVMGRASAPINSSFGGHGVGTTRPADSSKRDGQETEVEPG